MGQVLRPTDLGLHQVEEREALRQHVLLAGHLSNHHVSQSAMAGTTNKLTLQWSMPRGSRATDPITRAPLIRNPLVK